MQKLICFDNSKHLLNNCSLLLGVLIGVTACGNTADFPLEATVGPNPVLPPPESTAIPTVNPAPAVGWPVGRKPTAPPTMEVFAFADDLTHPRWLYVLPNNDVLVAETNAPVSIADMEGGIKGLVMSDVMEEAGAAVPSPDRILLLRDTDRDGRADKRFIFIDDLYSPFGMALVGSELYIANTDAILRFNYETGQEQLRQAGEVIAKLPAGPINYHWTKNIIASPDGDRLFVAVGSNSNIAENGMDKEQKRAAILEIDRHSGEQRIYASGLRNPVGMDWVLETGELWVAVNERDALGGDLVPDYMTAAEENGFYGWPYSYFGLNVDERVEPKNPSKVDQALVPDYALGAHTASLGLQYSDNTDALTLFGQGMFIGQHGSWNRDPLSGYKVIFVPFAHGRPDERPRNVLTGFLNKQNEAMGRPVGVVLDKRGELLVADDVGNTVWRVRNRVNLATEH